MSATKAVAKVLPGVIVLPRGYRGRPTNERYIEKGTYAIDHPALFGAGVYLLENGFAYDQSNPPLHLRALIDRDLAGNPIRLDLPENTSIVDPVVPIGLQPANSLGAADMAAILKAQGFVVQAPTRQTDYTVQELGAMLAAALQRQGAIVPTPGDLIVPVPADEPEPEPEPETDILGDLPPDVPEDNGELVSSAVDLESMSKAGLKKLAEGLGVKLLADDNKDDIIGKIRAHNPED